MQIWGGLDQNIDIMEMWPLRTGKLVLEIHSPGDSDTKISVLTLAGHRNDSELLKKHSTLAPRPEILTYLVGRGALALAFFKHSLGDSKAQTRLG